MKNNSNMIVIINKYKIYNKNQHNKKKLRELNMKNNQKNKNNFKKKLYNK